MKNTQGKWKASKNLINESDFVVENEEILVCSVSGVQTLSDEETEANATLIAAAPDLLNTLKTCLDTLIKVNVNGIVDNTILLTKQAIEKATKG